MKTDDQDVAWIHRCERCGVESSDGEACDCRFYCNTCGGRRLEYADEHPAVTIGIVCAGICFGYHDCPF